MPKEIKYIFGFPNASVLYLYSAGNVTKLKQIGLAILAESGE
jgi:hypothetical protein